MIFYFTSTGNCLHVARSIARHTDDALLSIPQAIRDENRHYADKRIGIIAPVYGHDIPNYVASFISQSVFETDYFFVVLTYGTRAGAALEFCRDKLSERGVNVAYDATLKMVDNWLPDFNMDEQMAMEKNTTENLARIIGDIASGAHSLEDVDDAARAANHYIGMHGKPIEADMVQDFLKVTEECIGCGICSQVCPSACMTIVNGTAQRDASSGFGCAMCLACIQACPAKAISIPGGEQNSHARFRNANVSLADIISANEQPSLK